MKKSCGSGIFPSQDISCCHAHVFLSLHCSRLLPENVVFEFVHAPDGHSVHGVNELSAGVMIRVLSVTGIATYPPITWYFIVCWVSYFRVREKNIIN